MSSQAVGLIQTCKYILETYSLMYFGDFSTMRSSMPPQRTQDESLVAFLNRYREIPNGLKRSSDGADGQEKECTKGYSALTGCISRCWPL
jgi:hypothetical protein